MNDQTTLEIFISDRLTYKLGPHRGNRNKVGNEKRLLVLHVMNVN